MNGCGQFVGKLFVKQFQRFNAVGREKVKPRLFFSSNSLKQFCNLVKVVSWRLIGRAMCNGPLVGLDRPPVGNGLADLVRLGSSGGTVTSPKAAQY